MVNWFAITGWVVFAWVSLAIVNHLFEKDDQVPSNTPRHIISQISILIQGAITAWVLWALLRG